MAVPLSDLSAQLADVFAAGLRADPSLRDSLAEALARDVQDTYTKAEANYRKATGDERCGNCAHFSDNRCDIVSGRIDPTDVCDEYDSEDNGAGSDSGE